MQKVEKKINLILNNSYYLFYSEVRMKTFVRPWCSILYLGFFLVIFLVSASYSQCNKEELITNVIPKNAEYLRYLQIENYAYDANISYTLGEFRICTNNKIHHINWDDELNHYRSMEHGDSAHGIDYKIMKLARTESFIYEPGTNLKFFRHFALFSWDTISRRHECKDQFDSTKGWWWFAGKGMILDSQEFVIQLVRKKNNEAIYCLDSIGLLANVNTCYAEPYGTDPVRYNHEMPLPDEYAGVEVYIRLVPKRWGPTPLGMEFILFPMAFNISYNVEFPGQPIFSSNLFRNDYEIIELKDFISAADTFALNHCNFPEKLDMFSIDNLGFAFIVGRYLEIYKNREIINKEKCLQGKKYYPEAVDSSFSVERHEKMRKKYHYMETLKAAIQGERINDEGNFYFAIRGNCDSIMCIEVINFDGDVLDTVWQGTLSVFDPKYNEHNITHKIPKLNDGYYLYALRDNNGMYQDFYPCLLYENNPVVCQRFVSYTTKEYYPKKSK